MMNRSDSLLFENGGKKRRKGFGWRKGTDQNVKALGNFAERLAQHVLGGVRSEELDRDCDLARDDLDVGMESKAGSNRDSVKLRVNQLDSHLALVRAGFPYSRYWYVFLKYRNAGPRNGGQKRLFQEMVRTEKDVPEFLGRNTAGLYVLDISLVEAVRVKQEDLVRVWLNNRMSPAVRVGWRFFDQLRDARDETLTTLELQPADYRFFSQTVRTRFEGHGMEFEFLSVLRRDATVRRRSEVRLFNLGRAAALVPAV